MVVTICWSMRVRETTYRMAERSSLIIRDMTVTAITFSLPTYPTNSPTPVWDE